MIATLAKPALAGLILAAGPALPRIDLRGTCSGIAAADARSCLADEGYARKKLLKYWGRTPDGIKRQCLYTAGPPAPSYVALRDCVNNAAMVRQIRGQRRPDTP